MNDKPDNQDATRMGDRDLTVFANRNLNYYPCTYSYANMNGAGNANIYTNINHAGQNQAWHFIYFGYSKAQARAYFATFLRSGVLSYNVPNAKHYFAERFFFVLRNTKYANFVGQMALINVVLGKDAFKVSDQDYFADNDVFNYEAGRKSFLGSAGPVNSGSGSSLLDAPTSGDSPFTKELTLE